MNVPVIRVVPGAARLIPALTALHHVIAIHPSIDRVGHAPRKRHAAETGLVSLRGRVCEARTLPHRRARHGLSDRGRKASQGFVLGVKIDHPGLWAPLVSSGG
jgi:hypothetical protein